MTEVTSMPIDNRDNPTVASCDHTGCTNTVTLTGDTLRQAQRRLVDNGWFWYVDYATVHATCAEHPKISNT